jgi:riboflavin kinase/FMN adenylyltransferase
MIVYETTDFKIKDPTAVTLGNFDGVHLGHQKLIRTVKEYAGRDNLKSVVFSFYPHPVSVFKTKDNFLTMLDTDEKKFVMDNLGVDVLVQYPFTLDFASLSPRQFFDMLVEKTNCKVLVVGENYYFGKDKAGDWHTLEQYAKELGILVIAIPPIEVDGERVSSSRVRSCIRASEMEMAHKLLNKPYFVIGRVAEGDKRGRDLSFPTINVLTSPDKLLPPNGVYLTRVALDGKLYTALTNVGTCPTFNGEEKRVETNIFDFDKTVYGSEVMICFYKWLREEKTFASAEELKAQLDKDKRLATTLAEDIKYMDYSFKMC